MSGTIVMTPVLMPAIEAVAPVVAGAATGGVALGCVAGLAGSVKRLIELQATAALAHRERELAQLEEWREHQRNESRRMELLRSVESAIQEAEQRLAALVLQGPAAATYQAPGDAPVSPEARSYLSLGKDRVPPETVARLLEELRAVVSDLPEAFREAERSAYGQLVRHHERLAARFGSGDTVTVSELSAFKETIVRTVADFRAQVAARQAWAKESAARLETCLKEILFYQHLAASPELALKRERGELGLLRSQFEALLKGGEVKPGALETLEKKLGELKSAVDQRVVLTAHRRELSRSVVAHLEDMGYGLLEPFEEEPAAMVQATLLIPGGEQLRIGLHPNGQMAFEVLHERSGAAARNPELTAEELAFLHQQEQRWCRDFRELVRRLTAEGFEYNVDFERALPHESVKVVVVETPDTILLEDEEARYHEEPRKRYMAP